MKPVKILTSVLIFSILLLSMSSISINASSKPSYETLKRIHNESTATSTSIDDKITKIKNITSEEPQNKSGDWLDPFVYEDYNGIIAYGVPHGDTANDNDAKNFYKKSTGLMRNSSGIAGEYKYLGVNYDGVNITNDKYFYTGSSGATFSSVKDYTDTKWQPIEGAYNTWFKGLTQSQVYQLAHTNFTDDDYMTRGEVPLTLKELLGDSLYNKAYIQCSPTMWTVSGSVRLQYNDTNWNTVIIPPLAHNSTITASIIAEDTYTIKAGQTEVEVPYQVEGAVRGDIVSAGKIDQLKSMDFVSLTVPAHGDFSNGLATQYAPYKNIYHRAYLHEGDNPVKITGSATVTTYYPEDKPLTAYADKIIHIIVEPEPPQEGTGTIQVKYLDYDTNKEISSYPISNVKYNTPTDVTRTILDGYEHKGSYQTGSPDADYDYFRTQMELAIKQIVTLTKTNENVNVYFWYHSTPPQDDAVTLPSDKCNLTASLQNHTVTAGEYISLKSSINDSLGHDITAYAWNAVGADEKQTHGDSITLLYNSTGVYNVDINVICSEGNTATATAVITVIDPTPTASINVSGKIKENRKINIDASKSESGIVPIDWSKTTWKIEPILSTGAKWEMGVKLLDGTVSTIDETNQSLMNSQKTFSFQARYAGEYKVDLTVVNAKGISATSTNIITVTPDLAPVAKFDGNSYILRDKVNPLGITYPKWGKFSLYDSGSYSPDGDPIRLSWGYRYNSNNNYDSNGNPDFSDETTVYRYTTRNLLMDPNFLRVDPYWIISVPQHNYSVVPEGYSGNNAIKGDAEGISLIQAFHSDAFTDKSVSGKEFTFSVFVKTQDLTNRVSIRPYWKDSNGQQIFTGSSISEQLTGTNDWTRLVVTDTAPQNAVSIGITIYVEGGKGTYWLSAPQVEEGSIATTYAVTPFVSGQRLVVDTTYNTAELWTYDVGKYAFELTVIENILDSETIKELLVDSDYKRGYAKDW